MRNRSLSGIVLVLAMLGAGWSLAAGADRTTAVEVAETGSARAVPARGRSRPSQRRLSEDAGTPEGLSPAEWVQIREAIEADRYRARPVEGTASGGEAVDGWGLELDNPAHGLRAVFDRGGLRLRPLGEEAAWNLDLRLVAWGREGALSALEPVEPAVVEERVEYGYGPLTEWFVNGEEGLEQGFTIERRPDGGGGALRLELDLGGRLDAEPIDGGRGLVLRDADGVDRVRYAGLVAWDATGRDLAAVIEPTARGFALAVEDAEAVYPVTVDPTFTEVAQVTGDLVGEVCGFCRMGFSVSVDGDTAVVGAYLEGAGGMNSGAAYVFRLSGSTWSQEQRLTASDGAANDQFGYSVSIAGDTAIVGSPYSDAVDSNSGSAYVFVRSGTVWTEEQKLTASDGAFSDQFGISVSLSGDTVVVGAHANDDAGADSGSAYVFVRSGTVWAEEEKLTASDAAAGDQFGFSVSVDVDTTVVGARLDDDLGSSSGSAYVFVRSGTMWTEEQKLTASDGAASDFFGQSVSLSSDTVVVGSPQDDDLGGSSGSAYVFVRSATVWTEEQKLIASDGTGGDYLGISVSVSGDTIVTGAYFDDDLGGSSGSAYVFVRSGTMWTEEQKLTASDGEANDIFGISVSVAGETALIGAYWDDDQGLDAGSAYMFVRSGTVWSEEAKVVPEVSPAIDSFGLSVSVSNDTAIVGSYGDDELGTNAGSAYVFVRSGTTWMLEQKLIASDGADNDYFGISVAVSGDTAIVGARRDDFDSGSAYVFTRSGSVWTEEQKLTASDGAFGDNFGISVSVSGDTAVIGAYLDDDAGSNAGSAYVFVRSGTVWTEEQKLAASDGDPFDNFGISVSVSGDTAVIGAYLDDDLASNAGAAYVFVRSGAVWTEEQKLIASDGAGSDLFGQTVSISGHTAVVGSPQDDDLGSASGSAYVFVRSGTVWTEEQKLTASDGGAFSNFGVSVSVWGDTAVVGAHRHDPLGESSGSAYVFTRSGSLWNEDQKLVASDGGPFDEFGSAVAAAATTVVIGAPLYDDSVADTGSAYIFEAVVNNPPVANDDSESVDEAFFVVIDAAANDTDPDGNLDPTSANTDCGTCTLPLYGALINNGDGTFQYDHGGGEEPADTFVYEICDTGADGDPLTNGDDLCDTATVDITVNPINDPPVVDAGPDVSTDEGTAWSSGGTVSDPDSPLASLTATVDYGDGTGQQALALAAGDFTLSWPYADNGVYTVTVEVTDDLGATGSDTLQVAVANVAPAVDAGSDQITDEGQEIFLPPAPLTDVGTLDTHTASIDWGDGTSDPGVVLETPFGPPGDPSGMMGTVDGSHVYADDGVYTVTVTVDDDDGGSTVDTFSVTVANVAPVVDAGADQFVAEGEELFLDPASFADAGTLDTHTATIDWGDATSDPGTVTETPFGPPGSTSGMSGTVDASHVYADNGGYTVVVTVTDDDGGSTSETFSVTVDNVAPTLEAGADASIDEGGTYSLDPSTFNDPGTADAHIATVEWGDGSPTEPGTVTEAPSGPPGNTSGTDGTVDASHPYVDDGVFTVTVTVTDDDAGSVADTLSLTVNNVAPTAVAGGPYTGDEGSSIVVDGSASSDPGNDIVSYDWDLDNDGTFETPGVTASFSSVASGTFTIGLRVTDDDGAEGLDTTTVTVTNVAPTAFAGGPYAGDEGSPIALDGSGSFDPGEDIVAWEWDLDNDGTYETAGVTVDFTSTDSGVFTVGLRVTDDDGAVGLDTTTVTVANVAPTAVSGGPYFVDEGEQLMVDGSGSFDPGNDIVLYEWDLDADGAFETVGVTATSTVEYPLGTTSLSFRVTDVDGATDVEVFEMTLVNVPPTADAGGPYSGNEGDTFSLDSSGSSDPGPITLREWDLDNDGTFETSGTVVPFSPAASGVFTVSLRVTDLGGATDVDTTTVTVVNVAPTAEAGGPYAGDEGAVIVVDGSGSSDPGNDIVGYDWDLDNDGTYETPGVTANFSSATSGAFTVGLQVTDDDGAVGIDTATVTVTNVAPTAVAGGPYAGDEGSPIPLDGSGSFDPGDDIVSWEWDLDNDGTHETPGVSVDFLSTDSGTFTVGLKVTDDDGAFDLDTTTVTVANVGPTADAGGPYVGDEGAVITVDGSASTDPGNDIVLYEWDLDDDGVIDASGVTADFTSSTSGTFNILLRVVDAEGAVGLDTTTVTVSNVAPTAEAGGPYTGDEGSSIVVDGSASSDPGNDIVSYDWDLDNDGTFETPGVTANFSSSTSGTSTVGLQVTDDDGAVGIDTATVTVSNVAPTAEAGGPYAGDENAVIVVDGSGSSDPGNDIVSYDWDLDNDGSFETPGVTASFSSATSGVFTVGLQVTDDDGAVGIDTATVTVSNVAPTAEAGGPYAGDEGAMILVDGSASSDPGNDIVAYDWDLDNDGTFETPGVTASFSSITNGEFTISLRVTDEDGGVGIDTTTVTVSNIAPVADAGGPYAGDEGGSIVVDGSGSFDPAFDIVSWDWDLDNDGTFETSGVTASFSSLSSGVFTIALQVTDDDGATDVDTTTVTVSNVAPTAEAGGPYAGDEGSTIVVDGSASSDPGNDIVSYDWDLDDDGAFETPGVTASFSSFTSGVFTISLQVTDDDGAVSVDSTTVTVSNVIPTADAGGPYFTGESETVVVDGFGSFDPVADIVDYAWDLDNDGTFETSGVKAFFSSLTSGVFTIALQVTDDDGAMDVDTTTVTVSNVAPTAEAGGPYAGDENATIVVDGSASSDPGNDIVSYDWDLDNDGTFETPGVTANFSSATSGVFTIGLQVTDDDGAVGIDTATVTVSNVAPTAEAGGPYAGDEGSTIVVDGSGSSDPGNDIVSYDWDLDNDGTYETLGVTANFDSATSGTFTIGLQVTDDDGAIGIDTATVTVANVAPVVDAGPDASIDEGGNFLSAGSFADPGAETWTATVDYGDGSGLQPLTLTGMTFSLDHVYADDGIYAVTVCVTDEDGSTGCDAAEVTVANIAPEVDAGPDLPVTDGAFASAGSFTDPGADTWTATVDYGDGSGVQPLTLTGMTFALVHDYPDKGVYVVTVCVSDDDGGTSCDTVTVTNSLSTTLVVEDATVQYSDGVELQATLTDSLARAVESELVTFDVAGVCNGSATTDASGVALFTCSPVGVAAGAFVIDVTYAGGAGALLVGSSASGELTVTAEDTAIAYDAGNPSTVEVATPGGASGPFDLAVDVSELLPDTAGSETGGGSLAFAGDISLASVAIELVPVGPGTSYLGTCSGSVSGPGGYDDVLTAVCGFDGVEVNTYTVVVSVDAGFYSGSLLEGVAIIDPDLGSVKGRGQFTWPTGGQTRINVSAKYGPQGTVGSLRVDRRMQGNSSLRLACKLVSSLAVGHYDDGSVVFDWASISMADCDLVGGSGEPAGHTAIVHVEDRTDWGSGDDRFWIEVRDSSGAIVPDLTLDEPPLANAVELANGDIDVKLE